MSLAVVLLAAGGGAVGLKILGEQKAPAPATPPTSGASKGGLKVPTAMIKAKVGAASVKPAAVIPPAGTFRDAPRSMFQQVAGFASSLGGTGATGGHPREVQDELERKAKAEWDKLSADAKRAACADLKRQYPNSPSIQAIPCSNPTFESVVTGIAAAGGVAVGTAVCGPACGAIGGYLGSLAGPKLAEWTEDAYDGAKEWAGDAAGEVYGSVSSGFGLW